MSELPTNGGNLHLHNQRKVAPVSGGSMTKPRSPGKVSLAAVPTSVETPVKLAEPLAAYLRSQPRHVRIFNPQLMMVWSNHLVPKEHPAPGVLWERTGGVPPPGIERDRWPVVRVFKGLNRATRLYSTGELVDSEHDKDFQFWRVIAWPLPVGNETWVAEETELVENAEDGLEKIEQLNHDIEDLLRKVVAGLQSGSDIKPLRLPNINLRHCLEKRECADADCPGHAADEHQRCWEITQQAHARGCTHEGLLDKFDSCSTCRVFDTAAPDPRVRISENFNRLISLLEMKYQETLDVQHRLQQADKLAIMGELLACIAHEIKNPLGIIIGRLDIIGLEMESMSAEVLSDDLGTIYQQANRVRHIIDHLLKMARPEPPAFQPVQLNSVVSESLAIVRKTLADKRIHVETELDSALPAIEADQIQMQQVLLNLILNARDAMAEGGHLRISSGSFQEETPGIRITVTDNGEGIPADQIQRLFSSFHTTKMNQGGTGLGLAVCRRIMRVHHGKIWAESTVGKGTSMHLWFPATRSQG